ncbi:MAG: AI-2E family transporter [Candidatus Eremiobacteraeota bacterium]|nr:AI-2E family transporter [Candidatus Eremiobacteraeota bacterium]
MTPALWRRIAIGIVVVLLVWAAFWLTTHIPRTIAIFVIAAFIAFGVHPIAVRLERRMPKLAAIAIVFAGLLLVIAIFLVIVIPLTISQMQELATNLPSYATAAQGWVFGAEAALEQHFPMVKIPASELNFGKIGAAQASSVIAGTVASLGAIAVNTATGFFIAFSAIILSFFFLQYDTQISESFVSLFPPRKRQTAAKLAAEVTELFSNYISGQVIVSAITGAVIAILSALIGFKFSLIIGIISGVAYAIPVVGMLIAQLIALPMCAPQGLWMIIWVQVIMFGMARISDNVLVPKIMGQSVGVSPIASMFAVFAGGELFGIPGLILGIPAAALIKILWRYFVAPWISAQLERTN